jgi:polar amino acid transport system substrate-binding protein
MLCGPAFVFAAEYTDYIGKSIGVVNGEGFGELAENMDWSRDIRTYSMLGDMLEDIRRGRIEAGITASASCNAVMAEGQYTDLDFLLVPKEVFSGKGSAVFKDGALRDKFNEWVRQAREDGVLDEMENRWLSGKLPPDDEIPVIPNEGTGGTLVCAMDSGYPPMTYMGENNKIVGYQVEVAERFAAFCDMKIRFDNMSYGAILPAIQSGKADFSNMFAITDEREANILFGAVALESTVSFIVKKPDEGGAKAYEDFIGKRHDGNAAESSAGFLSWLKKGVNNNLIQENRYKLVLNGLSVTLKISVLSLFFGTLIGSLVCFLLTRGNKIIRGAAKFYCGFIHGTPEVTLLMVAYYIVFGNSSIAGYFVAVAAFSLICGASVAGNLSGAIDTVDKTEIEAARALGFSPAGTFVKVTLPQAVRRALPGYADGFVGLVKSTAIVGYIAIQDLTRATDIIRSRTFDAYFPVIFSALIYLALTTFLIVVLQFIVKRVNGGIPK